MHTISSLRQTLGLSSANQVRNRMEAIKDLLIAHIRRGPNNQILLTDAGAELLRGLQDLHESGLTMSEASSVVRAKAHRHDGEVRRVSSRLAPNDTLPDHSSSQLRTVLDELAALRRRIALLEHRIDTAGGPAAPSEPWWSRLREDLDGA